MSVSSRASLEEEIYLRSLTGYLVGSRLFVGFRKVAVIAVPDRICSAMAAAALASYEAAGNYRDGAGAVFTYEQRKEGDVAKKVVESGADAVYLSFGGEQKMSDVNSMVTKIINALKEAGYRGALLIHVRAWLASKQLSTVISRPETLKYLQSLREIRVFTADANARKFYFNRVRLDESGAKLEKYDEVEITQEHANLLKISLPPPE
ncbi:MAG: hypothetical protein ACP5GH_06160 [Nitrososphaeria archaeon]